MASLSIPFPDFVAGTTIVSQQVDDNNAAILNYINARNAASANWDAVSTIGAFTSTLTSNQIILGTTRTVTITAPTPASASRTWTIPDITTDGTFASLTGAQAFTGAKTFSAVVGFADGLVGGPGVAFTSDPDCGMYRVGTNNIAFATGGAIGFGLNSSQNFLIYGNLLMQTALTQIGLTDGAVGTPSLTFSSDLDTGFYWISANDFAMSVGGVKTLEFTTTGSTNATTYNPLRINTAGKIQSFEGQSTTGVTTGATTILTMNQDGGLFIVYGKKTSGGSAEFIDTVLCGAGSSSVTVLGSNSVAGSPDARTYSTSASALRVLVAANTYTVTVRALGMNG